MILRMSLIYVHIPKTGGKTFKGILVRQGYRGNILIKPTTVFAKHWFNRLKSLKRRYKAIIGHMPFGVDKYYRYKGFQYVTILRNPIDRVISNYFHFLRPGYPLKEYQSMSFEDALDHSEDFNNLQTRILSGDLEKYNNKSGFKQIIYDSDLLNRAKKNLEKFAVVGFLDTYETFVKQVTKKFKWKPLSNYPYNNKAPNKKERSEIPQSIIEKIKVLNQMDIELYDWAKKKMC